MICPHSRLLHTNSVRWFTKFTKSLLIGGFCCAVSSHKEILQAFSQKKYQQLPAYRTISEGGPSDLKFGCTVELDGQLLDRHNYICVKKKLNKTRQRLPMNSCQTRR
jgi:dsRNA-specific ribonuclease